MGPASWNDDKCKSAEEAIAMLEGLALKAQPALEYA
jgi:hypothetical protein